MTQGGPGFPYLVMDQFKDGLALGVLPFMKSNFDLLRSLFVDKTPPLTVGMLRFILEPLTR